jgi:catechol 2,3-dioxygenase-like lactoylglutathione lyase family enzyme
MGFHHVAFATADTESTHRFYTEVMGFRLAKVQTGPTPGDAGFSKHFFYDTGNGEMIAFWEIRDPNIVVDKTAISTDLGLPTWVNHVAFDCPDDAAFTGIKDRWNAEGRTFVEVDHEWCRSVYVTDPNGIMVEFCQTTRVFSDSENAAAESILRDPAPTLEPVGAVTLHRSKAISS